MDATRTLGTTLHENQHRDQSERTEAWDSHKLQVPGLSYKWWGFQASDHTLQLWPARLYFSVCSLVFSHLFRFRTLFLGLPHVLLSMCFCFLSGCDWVSPSFDHLLCSWAFFFFLWLCTYSLAVIWSLPHPHHSYSFRTSISCLDEVSFSAYERKCLLKESGVMLLTELERERERERERDA